MTPERDELREAVSKGDTTDRPVRGYERTMSRIDNYDLNRWVAAHVLGWEYRERFQGDTQGYFGSVISEELPDFAGEMGAAWQVVDHLERFLWHVTVTRLSGETVADWDGPWEASFADPEACFLVTADTAPRAICGAALRAMGKGELLGDVPFALEWGSR